MPPGDSLPKAVMESAPAGSRFTLTQLQYDRVRDARLEMRYGIKKLFRERGLRYPAADIYLRVFKREHALELWVRPEGDTIFSMLRSYDICAQSGELGPKRARGDNQVPEGFYTIDRFNPYSDYHLSLHVDYPNASDQLTSTEPDLGGDIFIHGGCNSIGCLALTDEGIKELYWVAVEARAAGQQRIPIDIFPARLGDEEIGQLARVFKANQQLVTFWRTLKVGYDFFEKNRTLPNVRVDNGGRYVVNNLPVPGLPAGTPVVTPTKNAKTRKPLGTPLGVPLGTPVGPAGAPVTTGGGGGS
jgi:murein L,D-transpeptidase YafK